MRGTWFAVALAAAGCTSGGGVGNGCPNCGKHDGGGGFDSGGGGDSGMVAHGDHHRYVFNRILVPMQRSDFAIDLNGDGKPDDQFGNVVGALAAQNIDAQSAQDAAVSSGTTVDLADVQTIDPSLKSDLSVATTLYAGVPQAPDFSGNGSFAIDQGQPPAPLFGALVNGHFSSESPVTTRTPVSFVIKVSVSGGPPTPLPLNGVHVSFDTGTDAMSGAPGLVSGQLNGSIKQSDVNTKMIPQIAANLTQQVESDPNSSSSMQIEQIFDVGGCTDDNGVPAQASDRVITPCEVANNSIIKNVLAPDVQIYDANGNYAPNPANTVKDSLSVGLGFTAVRATF
jgi:hypothetical protein